jgi:hypothetical protein
MPRSSHRKERYAPRVFAPDTKPGVATAHAMTRREQWVWVYEFYVAERREMVPADPHEAILDFVEWANENRYRVTPPDERHSVPRG